MKKNIISLKNIIYSVFIIDFCTIIDVIHYHFYKIMFESNVPKRSLVSSTRESLNLILQVKSGKIPEDMYGYVFINTPSQTHIVCTLTHPEYNFGFTLHPVWVPEIHKVTTEDDHIEEYKSLINKLDKKHRQDVHTMFEQNVYPNFQNNKKN
ncbi:MAG: hypothetical protein EAZ85_01750 [Bacteroidetes bacterium]|nr:MAG: hypothetical protein EAZ85_01750 [Bacteroidota bacterium]TAG88358.1 MAG: hypothetical protein EAZ20_08720 [Bacteroidota bacterium]